MAGPIIGEMPPPELTGDLSADPTSTSVKLPDGTISRLPAGSTGADLAASIGPRLAQAAIAVLVDDVERDLGAPLPDGSSVSVITAASGPGREILRHSTAHVMAQAVTRLWPGAKYAIGPAIEDGFYYDFELPGGAHFADDDLARIEATMRMIIDEDQSFIREEHSVREGLEIFADQPYKQEIIEGVGPPALRVRALRDGLSGYGLSGYGLSGYGPRRKRGAGRSSQRGGRALGCEHLPQPRRCPGRRCRCSCGRGPS